MNTRLIDQLLLRFDTGKKTDLSVAAGDVLKFIRGKDQVPLVEILDYIIPHIREEDFILRKNYTMVASVPQVFGKWP